MKNDSAGKHLNFRMARGLEEVAQILETQGANPFPVQAYRHAADTLRHLTRPAEEILRQEGEPGLRKLPGIGARQCSVINSQRGPLIGARIVRGRESECLGYYRQTRIQGMPVNNPPHDVQNSPPAHVAAG